MRIQATDAALLIVDIQERLMPAMYNQNELMNRMPILMKGLQLLGVPALLFRQYPKGLGDIIPEVREAAGKYTPLDKLSFSVYEEEACKEAIRATGKKNMIVCGVETHVCILQSLIDLKADGYNPVLVCDCIGSRRAYDTEIGIYRAVQEGVTVTTSESLLLELQARAGNETFKAISKLIK